MATKSRVTKKDATKKPQSALSSRKALVAEVDELRSLGQFAKAIRLLKGHAADGDPHVMQLLGDQYQYSSAATRDLRQALRWYERAAALGAEYAARNVARLLAAGEGVADPAAHLVFLERHSAEGHQWAIAERLAALEAREIEVQRPRRLALTAEQKLRELTARFGLKHRLRALLRVARPSVLLLGHAEDTRNLGTNRMGGEPDAPPGFVWPRWHARPLTFIAQLNLASMQALVEEPSLPRAGLLSFFYDTKEQPWGDPGEEGAWLVHFADAAAPLERTAIPKRGTRLPPFALTATRELTLPFTRTAAFRAMGFDSDEVESYAALLEAYQSEYCSRPSPKADRHRFLGHPDALQGDMSRRLEYDEAGVDPDEPVPALEEAAREWRFLFQVGSDVNQAMCWGDDGRLFFWMRERDLAAGRFGKARLQLQCH